MVSFLVEGFGGKDMKHDPRRIADNKAQTATDCELERGTLHPLAAESNAGVGSIPSSSVSMFWYDRTTWLSWTTDTDAVEVPIPNDKYERALVTQAGTYPRLYAAGAYYRLGVPAPSNPSTVTVTEPPVEGDEDQLSTETISYVYTFVDAFGAEGPPSPPSAVQDKILDTAVGLTFESPPSGTYNWGSGAVKRIYRSATGSGSSYFLFVAEIPIATNAYTDEVKTADLQEVVPSVTWVGPPDDDTSLYPDGPMLGVCAVANGFCAGFSHKTVCFSEPFLPHAWPMENRITLDEPIVGICAIAAGVLVVTERRPYLVSGAHPSAMALTAINESQGLVSKRGLVDMGAYAIYPSADGLVLVEGAGARIITGDIITYEDWKYYSPHTIEAYHEEGKYVAFYNGAACFIFDPRGGDNSFIDANRYYRAGFHDGPSGKLLLNSGGTIVSWGDDTTLANSTPYLWKSKKYVSPKPLSFSAMRVEVWESLITYPVIAKVYADGVDLGTITFDTDPPYDFRRLPSGFRAKIWEIELYGNNPVSYVGLYESMGEMA